MLVNNFYGNWIFHPFLAARENSQLHAGRVGYESNYLYT